MTKLHQLIAVANTRKSDATSEMTKIYQMLQKPDLLAGLTKTYRPANEEGEKLPDERINVRFTVEEGLTNVRQTLEMLLNTIGSQELSNTEAKADVMVDGKVLLKDAPVAYLLFLEKQLLNLQNIIGKIPTLDPAHTWELDPSSGYYRSEKQETHRTKKVPKVVVLHAPTKEHPAQTQLLQEDILAGYWEKYDFSGAVPAMVKNEMLERVKQVQEAVKFAREQANSVEVKDYKSTKLLEYIFGSK